MNKFGIFSFMALALAISISASTANAQTTLEPICRGSVDDVAIIHSNCASDNSFGARTSGYVTGGGVGIHFRGFFQYALPSKPAGQKVVAATLRIQSFEIRGGGQTVSFHTVPPSVEFDNALNRPHFSDLGQGSPIASQLYLNSDNRTTKDIVLNAGGLAAINSALGTNFAISAKDSPEDESQVVFADSGEVHNNPFNITDTQTELILTFGPDADITPTISWNGTSSIRPSSVPVCFDFTPNPSDATLELDVLPVYVNGSGKIIDKSESAQWYVSGNQVCITNSGGIGTRFFFFASATNSNGGVGLNFFTTDVVKKK